jgi:hypothetical protein
MFSLWNIYSDSAFWPFPRIMKLNSVPPLLTQKLGKSKGSDVERLYWFANALHMERKHNGQPAWRIPTDWTPWVMSKSHCNWRPVSQSVLVSSPIQDSWPDISYCLTFTILSLWGALSDERTCLSFVRITVCSNTSFVIVYNIFTFYMLYMLINVRTYNIYKASISPG